MFRCPIPCRDAIDRVLPPQIFRCFIPCRDAIDRVLPPRRFDRWAGRDQSRPYNFTITYIIPDIQPYFRPTGRAGIGLSVETAIERVVVFGLTGGTHGKDAHG